MFPCSMPDLVVQRLTQQGFGLFRQTPADGLARASRSSAPQLRVDVADQYRSSASGHTIDIKRIPSSTPPSRFAALVNFLITRSRLSLEM